MVHSVSDETRGEAVQVKISGDHLGVFFPAPDIIVPRAHSSAPIAHLGIQKVGAGMRRERSACAPVYAGKDGKKAEKRKKN
jgi:hypothetical protein